MFGTKEFPRHSSFPPIASYDRGSIISFGRSLLQLIQIERATCAPLIANRSWTCGVLVEQNTQ